MTPWLDRWWAWGLLFLLAVTVGLALGGLITWINP